MFIREEIKKLIQEAVEKISPSGEKIDVSLEHPLVREHGDYASNVAMKLSRVLKQAPIKIAEQIVSNLPKNELIGKAEAVNPGFINIHLSENFLWEEIREVLEKQSAYGQSRLGQDKRVLIEHTQINPNKEPHVGHLRNACLGDSLVKIYGFLGYDVKTLYYQNDVGQQIASILLARVKKFVKEEDYPSLLKWASAAYTDMDTRLSEDSELQKEKEQIQIKIAAQNTKEAKEAEELTDKILEEVLEIFDGLGIDYDLIVKESDILKADLWGQTFRLLQTKDSFYQAADGERKDCWMIRVPGSEDKIIVRSNGVPTYAGNDIANHLWKFGCLPDFKYQKFSWQPENQNLYTTSSEGGETRTDFPPADQIINVIDQTQTYPQQSVIESLRVLGYKEEADNYYHVNYGFVYLSKETAKEMGLAVPEGANQLKMSGRKGSVVSITNFLKKMEELLEKERGKFEALPEVRNGAVKFEMLKYNTYQDIVFDLETALDLRGFSGPYLQYAATRVSGILRKAENKVAWTDGRPEFTAEENNLLRTVYIFPEIIRYAAEELAPHHLCLYLFQLAQEFHAFYEKNQVIGSDKEKERLAMVAAVRQILETGLNLLGLAAPERM